MWAAGDHPDVDAYRDKGNSVCTRGATATNVDWGTAGGEYDIYDSHDTPSGGSAPGGAREIDDYSGVDEYGDGKTSSRDRWVTTTLVEWGATG